MLSSIDTVPATAHEIERIRRVEQLETSPARQLPTSLRSRPGQEAAVTIDEVDANAIQAEPASVEPVIKKKLITLRRAGHMAR